ncbi:hypothetical protein TTHERM_00583450 (macronuclear) [Tetrahymena thermophila SB210]|uniref:Uncharacterized protein n=1 Tax=Tetrahymena thermophila (strain SB210) TaxID=312017 RepID=Q23Q44_TETTS|nr:hypothetical protein TTHERM_00583450 [Tetrahymena thermophila SB210]EAR98740.3 hypothetical protein TTHERM_00583450 [Tetrahymena thermophila SB210]|eukprot:XP_001018985.3 hypothetical protein TTHERM_00583450 [Tetrahymena thermophila SB210]
MEVLNTNFEDFTKNQVFECQIHKQRCTILYLEVDNNQDSQASPFKCTKCLTKNFLDPSKCLSLYDIFTGEDNTILDNWPLFGQKNYIFTKAYEIEKINLEETFNFFKGFKSSVIEKLEKIEDKLKSQYQIIENNKKLLKDYYNTVSLKKNIQNALYQIDQNPEQSKKQIKEYIQQVQGKRQTIEGEINYIYKTLSFYQDYLSTYSLKQFTSSIDSTLDSMEKVVNYEIFDVLESQENNIVVSKQQKENFNNQVFYCSQEQLYSVKYYNQKNQSQENFNIHFYSIHQTKNSQSYARIQAIKF